MFYKIISIIGIMFFLISIGKNLWQYYIIKTKFNELDYYYDKDNYIILKWFALFFIIAISILLFFEFDLWGLFYILLNIHYAIKGFIPIVDWLAKIENKTLIFSDKRKDIKIDEILFTRVRKGILEIETTDGWILLDYGWEVSKELSKDINEILEENSVIKQK